MYQIKHKIEYKHSKLPKLLSALSLVFLAAHAFSCHKEEPEEIDLSAHQLKITDSSEENPFDNKDSCWQYTNKKIYILFGYDFNDQELVTATTNLLSQKYGLTSEGGLINTITYPDSFKHNGKNYISELTSMLTEADGDLLGVIILGAPENTHISLARLQDEWNMSIPFPIAALFPQDDVLGLEATCDIVIDRMQTGDMVEESFSNDEIFITQKAPKILCQLLDYLIELEAPLPKNSSVQANAMQMFRGEKLAHYLDPETGLQSVNHFILY